MTRHVHTILIIDDDRMLGETLCDALADEFTTVLHATTGAEGMAVCRRQVVDLVLLDQKLPDADGAALCAPILKMGERTKVVFMTAYPNFDNAVAALKLGAVDYLAKPFEVQELELTVRNLLRLHELENIEQLHSRRRQEEVSNSVIVGGSRAIREAVILAERAAEADAPVLILGETGTGKTLLAKHIHYNSRRRDSPFVSVNCAALPETLAESELFGHVKGAFTGADAMRRGIFEIAENGTVLLDEIGAMPLSLQAKLLGVLEDRTVRRLGGESSRSVTATVIAATNLNLEHAVAAGSFRRDLFFRLGVVPITVPPLRDRLEDLGELTAHLIRAVSGRTLTLDEAELARLAEYGWPGNVRELRNILERALIVQGEDRFEPSRLLNVSPYPQGIASAAEVRPHATLAEVERRHIDAVLKANNGNLSRSSKDLGIALSTLKRKLKGSFRAP